MGAAVTPLAITAPQINYGLLMPFLIVFAGACLGVLVEAALARPLRLPVQLVLTFLTLAAALVSTVWSWATGERGLTGVLSVAVDGPTHFMWALLLVFSALSFLLFADRTAENGRSAFAPQAAAVPGTPAEQEAIRAGVEHTEVFPLALFALSGMMVFAASSDLITMFVALEILSLPLYLLCGLARRRRLLSQEAALKYFLLGALSSAFFLYGVALLYGYAASFDLSVIDAAIRTGERSQGLLLAGMGLLGVGLLFKFGAVPFHSWTPDVYAGAPTPVTAFMAACTKIAALGALMRVFYVALGAERWDWQPLMAIVAVATMAVGSVLAITQTDVKRMLAYSSIAHAGFLMTAFVGAAQEGTGNPAGSLTSVSSVMFYLVAYGAATLGAFAVVTLVRDPSGEATLLHELGRSRQAVAGGRGGVLDLPAELRRHPADQRVHRQVGGVRGRLERRAGVAGRGGRRDQRRRGDLLHPGDRDDVLLRTRHGTGLGDPAGVEHARRRWGCCGRYCGSGCLPGTRARFGSAGR